MNLFNKDRRKKENRQNNLGFGHLTCKNVIFGVMNRIHRVGVSIFLGNSFQIKTKDLLLARLSAKICWANVTYAFLTKV